MIEYLAHYIDIIAKTIEFLGVLIMVAGLLFAVYLAVKSIHSFTYQTYLEIRQAVGKSILLGLEVLIAADIMATNSSHHTYSTGRADIRFYCSYSYLFKSVITSGIRRSLSLAKQK